MGKLSDKSICQIGLISEDLDTGETILPELNLYVNPEDNYDDNCIAVHHITNEKLKIVKHLKICGQVLKNISLNQSLLDTMSVVQI